MANDLTSVESMLSTVKDNVYQYVRSKLETQRLGLAHLHDGVSHALGYGGKCLRPAALLLACEAVGGDARTALPAAAAIEIYHTWTLVHDDVIDRDLTRRGHETIHEEFRRRAILEYAYEEPEAKHYGISMAILVGDVLQGWSISCICDLVRMHNIDAALAIYLIEQMTTHVQNTLVEGETLDIQFSKVPIEQLTESDIIEMLRKKTAVLYEFAGRAGAMIGQATHDPDNSLVQAIAKFSSYCGVAFQIQDDVLGIIGSEETLGKPVGSDLREGKKTIMIHHAFSRASERERLPLLNVLGNQNALKGDIDKARDILVEMGSIKRARELARAYIDRATSCLNEIPHSAQKQRLLDWAEYLIAREV